MLRATYGQLGIAGRQRERGQSIAEFALVLMVLLLLILGIMDFSRLVYARNMVASVAREGARYKITHPTATDSEVSQVAKALVSGVDKSQITVTVSEADALHWQVDVTYRFQPVTAMIGRYVDGGSGTGILLHGRSKMRKE